MAKTSLTVTERTLERFNDAKETVDEQQASVPNHSADSFLNMLLDTFEAVNDEHYQDESKAEVIQEIREELAKIDTQQETLDGKKEIVNRIDDLENELTTRLENLQRR